MTQELTPIVEDLIAFEKIRAYYSSFSDKAEARVDEGAKGLYNRLAAGEKIPEDVKVIAEINTALESKAARTMKEAIDEFAVKHPKQGEELYGLIDEKRSQSNIYLRFGLKEGSELPKASYLRVFRDLGINPEDTHKMYYATEEVVKKLRKRQLERIKSKLIGLDKKVVAEEAA